VAFRGCINYNLNKHRLAGSCCMQFRPASFPNLVLSLCCTPCGVPRNDTCQWTPAFDSLCCFRLRSCVCDRRVHSLRSAA
jgi:hypothetical protein